MPLTLVAAAYDVGPGVVSMTFSRAVDITGLVVNQVVVKDGFAGVEYGGTGDVTQPTPATVEMVMIENGPFEGAGVTLNVSASNGIVAVGDGAPFAGVTDLELPFP